MSAAPIDLHLRTATTTVMAVAALATVAFGTGCEEVPEPGCRRDSECGVAACVAGECLPRAAGGPTWAVEVSPRDDSTLALSELNEVSFRATPVELVVERKVPVAGSISWAQLPDEQRGGTVSARVILSFDSAIPGRPAVQYETTGASRRPQEPLGFSLELPPRGLAAPARLRVVPSSPADETLPPWSFSLDPGPTIGVTIPGETEVVTLEGRLEAQPPEEPLTGYVARVLLGATIVSNSFPLESGGRFKLRIPRPVVAASGADLLLELRPAPGRPRPRLIVKPDFTKSDLGVLRLPAYPAPVTYEIPVVATPRPGGDPARVSPVRGATVHFRTPLGMPKGPGPQVFYDAEAQTGDDGKVRLSLIPGTLGNPDLGKYVVSVSPSPNAEHAARCVLEYVVAPASPGPTRVGKSIEVGAKVQLAGTVTRSDGAPARGVAVRAQRKREAELGPCGADLRYADTTTTTAPDGTYGLLLDPGTYRIEYTPPAGAASPRFVEEEIVVSASKTHAVRLPAAVVAEGRVLDPSRSPARGSEIRCYDPSRPASPVGVGQTDADGRFRIVLPRLP
jgi:hypothetical protein